MFRFVALECVVVRQLRWVKLWCGEVCCGLSGLGSYGTARTVVFRYVQLWQGRLSRGSARQLRLVEVRFGLSGRCAVRAARFGKAVKASCV